MASLRPGTRRDGSIYVQVLYRLDGKQSSTSFEDLASAQKFQKLVVSVRDMLVAMGEVADRVVAAADLDTDARREATSPPSAMCARGGNQRAWAVISQRRCISCCSANFGGADAPDDMQRLAADWTAEKDTLRAWISTSQFTVGGHTYRGHAIPRTSTAVA